MNSEDIRRVLVIGAGTMGRQIALQCALHGLEVDLYDAAPAALAAARAEIDGTLAYFARAGRLSPEEAAATAGRLSIAGDLAAAARADLVSESVPEDPALKGRVFAELNALCPPRTVFTTNSSTLLPSMFAAATGRPERFAALHFHLPPWEANVVDVMAHDATAPEVVDLLVGFARRIGQIPIVAQRESSGYVFNAMLSALNGAALKLAAGGVASVADVDRAWMGVMKTPIGPFGIMDMVGLETVWKITDFWATALGDPELRANADFVKEYIDRGRLGRKNGRGFYDYPHPAFADEHFLQGEER